MHVDISDGRQVNVSISHFTVPIELRETKETFYTNAVTSNDYNAGFDIDENKLSKKKGTVVKLEVLRPNRTSRRFSKNLVSVTGYSYCHPKDCFRKDIGRKVAFQEALNELNSKEYLTKDDKKALWSVILPKFVRI